MSAKKEPEVFIHLQPTERELHRVWLEQCSEGTIFHLPSFVWSRAGWLDYFNPPPKAPRAISFCPVVIEVDGHFPAMIYLTDLRERGKSAQVHFAAHAAWMPKTTFVACKLALDMLLGSAEVNLLEVSFEESNVRAKKMARAMGFVDVARAGGCVYCLKTSKGDIYVPPKSTKTNRSAESGGSGHSGESRSSGRGRGRASSSATAEGSCDHLPGESNGRRAVCKCHA